MTLKTDLDKLIAWNLIDNKLNGKLKNFIENLNWVQNLKAEIQ